MTCKNQCANCKRRDPIAEQMAAAHQHIAPNGPQDIEDTILRIELVVAGRDLKMSSDAEIEDVALRIRQAMERVRTQANTPVNTPVMLQFDSSLKVPTSRR